MMKVGLKLVPIFFLFNAGLSGFGRCRYVAIIRITLCLSCKFRLPIEDDGDGRGAWFSQNGVHHERLAVRRNGVLLSVRVYGSAAHVRREQPKRGPRFDSLAV